MRIFIILLTASACFCQDIIPGIAEADKKFNENAMAAYNEKNNKKFEYIKKLSICEIDVPDASEDPKKSEIDKINKTKKYNEVIHGYLRNMELYKQNKNDLNALREAKEYAVELTVDSIFINFYSELKGPLPPFVDAPAKDAEPVKEKKKITAVLGDGTKVEAK